MTRETMIDPRGREYGLYVATMHGTTVGVAFYGDEETVPRFTLQLSAADYPTWRSHVGGDVLTAGASWDAPEFHG